jgi:two-component system nitrate/nitrite response regulator NarP
MSKILIADDHPIVLEGLVSLFRHSDVEVTARCKSGVEVMKQLDRGAAPDILLLDVHMPPPGGLAILGQLKEEDHPAKIILLTASLNDGQIIEAVRLGADGIILKESAPQQLLACVEAIRGGRRWFDAEVTRRAIGEAASATTRDDANKLLTPREREVVRLVARGLRNKEIAYELGIAEGTVKMHLHTVYDKLAVTSRMEMLNIIRDRELLI